MNRDRSPLALARLAGVLAVVTLVTGTFAGSVGTRLIVLDDAAKTASNIRDSESLFRLGMVSSLAMYVVFIFYVVVLYRLLKPVDRSLALLMMILGLVGVPIAMLNQTHQAAALQLLSGAEYLGAFPAEQIEAQAMLHLRVNGQGNVVGAIFWGLWLFPLGRLVFKSGFLPRTLGVLLMIGCFGWLAVVVQRFLFPAYEGLANARYAAHVAELAWMLWLLVRGVNVERYPGARGD